MKSNRGWVFAFWGYFGMLITIIVSAYLRIIPVKISTIPFYDTLGHFILLGIAAYLSHLALNKRRVDIFNIFLPLAPILVSIFTLIEEILQTLSPYRTFSISDLTADLCGIVLFAWLAERTGVKRLSSK